MKALQLLVGGLAAIGGAFVVGFVDWVPGVMLLAVAFAVLVPASARLGRGGDGPEFGDAGGDGGAG